MQEPSLTGVPGESGTSSRGSVITGASMLPPCRTAISRASHRRNPSPPREVEKRWEVLCGNATLGIRHHDAVQTVLPNEDLEWKRA
jgi:hypothetical protein